MSLNRQYAIGLSGDRIEAALVAAGLDLNNLQRADLTPLEDFHTMGRIATSQLAELAAIERSDEVLDAGSGIGAQPAISPTSSAAVSRPSTLQRDTATLPVGLTGWSGWTTRSRCSTEM